MTQKDINLNRIKNLKQKFKLPVGYGHHYIGQNPNISVKAIWF